MSTRGVIRGFDDAQETHQSCLSDVVYDLGREDRAGIAVGDLSDRLRVSIAATARVVAWLVEPRIMIDQSIDQEPQLKDDLPLRCLIQWSACHMGE